MFHHAVNILLMVLPPYRDKQLARRISFFSLFLHVEKQVKMCTLPFTILQSLNIVMQRLFIFSTRVRRDFRASERCEGLWSTSDLRSAQSMMDFKSNRYHIKRIFFLQYLRVSLTCSLSAWSSTTFKNRATVSLIKIKLLSCSQSQLREFRLFGKLNLKTHLLVLALRGQDIDSR